MKNFTALLQRGNLKPKERVLLWVQNKVAEETTGKDVLTEADKHALIDGWKPKDNNEAKEYNRYNDGWRTAVGVRLDSQTSYLNVKISLLRAEKLVDFAMWADYEGKYKDYLKRIDNLKLGVSDDDTLNIILQNSGLEFDSVVYGCAFENLSADLKKDILTLYPDAENEKHYLDQEETLALLFDGKNKLTTETKEKLTDAILETMHNKYASVIREKGLKSDEWHLYSYYADLPTLEIAKRWANKNMACTQEEVDDLEKKEPTELASVLTEKMEAYAEKHAISMHELLKKTLLDWLDNGLFIDSYAPLCHSNRKETCNGADTILPHNEIFAEWLKAKEKAQTIIQRLVGDGKLKVESRDKELFGVTRILKMITGESLYNLRDDFVFATDYKKQVDGFKFIGGLILFLRQHFFLKEYASLLGFVDIFKRLSRVYEIDLTYKINTWIADIDGDIKRMNNVLFCIADEIEMALYKEHGLKFLIEIFMSNMKIGLEKVEQQIDESVEHYTKELEKILDGEF